MDNMDNIKSVSWSVDLETFSQSQCVYVCICTHIRGAYMCVYVCINAVCICDV